MGIGKSYNVCGCIFSMNYAVIDVETSRIRDGEIPRTKFWGFANENGYERFPNTGALLRFLRGLEPTTLLHHYNFDLLQMLVDGGTFNILRSHNGKIIKTKLLGHTTLNTGCIFPVALAKLFEAFGFKKTGLEKLEQRNYEDCVNGLACFLGMDETIERLTGVSALRSGTIAATGFKALLGVTGRPMPIDDRFVSSFRGGRADVFFMDECNANKFDIASSYPRSIIECPREATLLQIQVKTKDFYCPFFEAKNTDMLLFPNGSFSSWVFDDNFEKYIEPYAERTSIKVSRRFKLDFSWLHETKDFFRNIFDLKSKSIGAVRECCKLLLNSAYGRMGLRGESERARILDYIPDGDEVTVYKLGREKYLCFDSVVHACKSNFAFAAYITCNARARLFEAFKRNRGLYGDTDSIITQSSGLSINQPVGSELGAWQKEGTGRFKADNVKEYVFDGKEAFKGGRGHTLWTLKQFAAGKTAVAVERTKQTGLRKRIATGTGWTIPITIGA